MPMFDTVSPTKIHLRVPKTLNVFVGLSEQPIINGYLSQTEIYVGILYLIPQHIPSCGCNLSNFTPSI